MRMSLISTEWPLPSLNSTVASARRLGLSGGVMALTDTCIGYSSCRGNRAIEDELFYGFARDANEAANFTKCNLATENPRPQRRRFDPQQRRPTRFYRLFGNLPLESQLVGAGQLSFIKQGENMANPHSQCSGSLPDG